MYYTYINNFFKVFLHVSLLLHHLQRVLNLRLLKLRTIKFLIVCAYKILILAGVPGDARDEKLQKQIFEITWRDKGWIS